MLTAAAATAFMKEYWPKTKIEEFTYKNRPLLAMIDKDEEAGGEVIIGAIDLDDGAEGGPTFSDAQLAAQNTSSQKRQFVVPWVEDFQLAQVKNILFRLMRKNPDQALERAGKESERAMRILADRHARMLYRSGWGEKGQMNNASVAVSTITLASKSDVRNFRIGDMLTFSQSLNGHTLRDSGDYVSVTAIDPSSGTITTDASPDLATKIASIGLTDFIFLKGARENSATPTALMGFGLASWIPDSAPGGSDSFCGVNRSVWTDRLAGYRYPASGSTTAARDEAILAALIEAGYAGTYPTHLFCSGDVMQDLIIGLEGRHEKIQTKVGNIGFSGIRFDVGNGEIKAYGDSFCPANRAYALTLDDWHIRSAGPFIQNDLQNGKMLDLAGSSGTEFRWVSTFNVQCDAPKGSMVIKLG